MEPIKYKIPFNKPSLIGNELKYISRAIKSGKISGDGIYSDKCTEFFTRKFHIRKILFTPSCSAALDMTALLLKLDKNSEVITPSFTFTSTVNAFVLRGAKPVFVDIRSDTLNIDENLIEKAISKKTKAIYCMHYAGISCEMEKIQKIAQKYDIPIVEDAAQGINAKYKNKYLGTIGDLGAYSFHETKNTYCGEGGALVINNSAFDLDADIIREKGTNRTQFFRGEIKKYTWHAAGSSYLLSDILAAYLYAQLENIDLITKNRKKLFMKYSMLLRPLEKKGLIRLPFIPSYSTPNFHIFYIITKSKKVRTDLCNHLKTKGILAVSHYEPLHISPMGKKFGYRKGILPITENLSGRLVRLPLFHSLTYHDVEYICNEIRKYYSRMKKQ